MTLPASGPISIGAATGSNDISVEFLLPRNSVFPTAFYGLGGVPSSGALSFGDFYGRTRAQIVATKYNLQAFGFLAADNCTITVTGGTIASWSLISGVESTQVSKPATGVTSSGMSVSTPGAGNGDINNTYRIFDSNGNSIDISVNANWDNA